MSFTLTAIQLFTLNFSLALHFSYNFRLYRFIFFVFLKQGSTGNVQEMSQVSCLANKMKEPDY